MQGTAHDWYHYDEREEGGSIVEQGYICRRCYQLAIIAGVRRPRTPEEEANTVAMLSSERCPGDRRRVLEIGGAPAAHHRWQRFHDVDLLGTPRAGGYTCVACGAEFYVTHRDLAILTGTEEEEEARFAARVRDRECKGLRVRELGARLAGQP